MKKMKISVAAALIFAAMFSVSSCKKECLKNPTNNSSNLLDALLRKTNGGKQANSIYAANSSVDAGQNKVVNPLVFLPNAQIYGSSQSVWSGKWWKWALELPPVANHPFYDNPGFDVTMGQTGNVWFLAGVFGTVTRTCTIPAGKALDVALVNAEASDLEGLGNTYSERLATAKFYADHIVVSSLFCTVDGLPVTNLSSYRFVSPQFTFTAPTPWIEGSVGGNGTSVADGYYVMVKPFDSGTNHTLHYGGAFHFAVAEGDPFDFDASIDMTYNLTVQ